MKRKGRKAFRGFKSNYYASGVNTLMLKFITRNKIKKQYVEIFVEVLLFSTPIPLKTYNVPQILN